MDIIRFALGFRFDPSDSADGEVDRAVSAFLSCVDKSLLQGLKLYAGHFQLNENDNPDILTLIIMGGGLKQSRKVYNAVKSSRYLMSLLADRRPIIQSNVMFKFDGFEHLGDFDENGNLSGGERAAKFTPLQRDFVEKANTSKTTIVLAPDKYKGTFDQFTAVRMLKQTARRILPGAMLVSAACADGGDGTSRVLSEALNGKSKKATVTGPEGAPVEAEYCIINRDTAVVEMAAASGLALLKNDPDPMQATSFGTGELIADALKHRIKKLWICVGGSATNDGGMGAAIALGAKFLDEKGIELSGCGANTALVHSIDLTGIDPRITDVEIGVLCDVNNPLTGDRGATYTFGPQKGADGENLEKLEEGIKNLEKLYNEAAGRPVCSEPGAGAAGGIGAMLAALFGAKLFNGAEAVLSAIDFNEKIRNAQFVITGEGCFDRTSTESGKAVSAVINACRKTGIKCCVLAGCRSPEMDIDEKSVIKVITAYDKTVAENELKATAQSRFIAAAEELFKSIAKGV